MRLICRCNSISTIVSEQNIPSSGEIKSLTVQIDKYRTHGELKLDNKVSSSILTKKIKQAFGSQNVCEKLTDLLFMM